MYNRLKAANGGGEPLHHLRGGMPKSNKFELMARFESIEIISRVGPIQLTEIITSNIHYAGSTIVLKEKAIVRLSIDEPDKVDSDFEWYFPQFKLGTYQIANWRGDYSHTPRDEGFFTSETTIFERCHQYIITADPAKPNVYDQYVTIEQCNFRLVPELIPIDGVATLTYLPTNLEPILAGNTKIAPPELAEATFYQELGIIAMKLKPGVSFEGIDYTVGVANAVYNASAEFLQPNCSLPQVDCNLQFAAFVLANNNGLPIDSGSPPLIFSSNDNCRSSSFPPGSPAQCVSNIFTCSDGGTREYWTPPQG
jgi:hypothetical protein